MPYLDGTGPYGFGPVGRGLGPCGRGYRRGYGRYYGWQNNGYSRFNQQGWFGYNYAHQANYQNQPQGKEQIIEELKAEEEYLKQRLEEIKRQKKNLK